MTQEPRKLSPAFLKAVGDYVLIDTELARADVCLLFGNKEHPDHLAEHAAELYHQGYFERIVVSGGPVTDDGRQEAQRMRDVLLSNGVPSACILIEDRAMDTQQNVEYTKALLERDIGLANITSVLAIGHLHASRRFLMTLERQWPEVTKMFSTNNCYSVPKEQWHEDPVFREMVLTEYQRIQDKKANDTIREIAPQEISRAIAKLPPPGFKGAA